MQRSHDSSGTPCWLLYSDKQAGGLLVHPARACLQVVQSAKLADLQCYLMGMDGDSMQPLLAKPGTTIIAPAQDEWGWFYRVRATFQYADVAALVTSMTATRRAQMTWRLHR